MQNKIRLKTIEDIAIQFIINTIDSDNDFEDTINTIKDPKISIKGCTSLGGSFYCRTNKFFENENYIFFRKIPQKTLSEDELLTFATETEESSSKATIYNSNTIIKINHTKIFARNCKNLKYSKKLFFPLKYYLVYDCLSELYLPLISNLEDINNLRNYIMDIRKKVDYFSTHESVYEKSNDLIEHIYNYKQLSNKVDEFLEEEKCCEIIAFSLILFILHLMLGAKIQYNEIINDEDMETIYGEICFVLHKMLENIMFKLLFNENYNKQNKNIKINDKKGKNNKNQNNSISFESVCSRYVKDYFKGVEKSQNKIINDLNSNLGIIFQRLYNAVNILLLNFTKGKISSNNVDNPDEIESYFLNLLDYNFQEKDSNEIYINENDIKNDNNNKINDKEMLQKEFIDQYNCFKIMFYFLTHKEIKNNIFNDDNNINISNNININNNINISNNINNNDYNNISNTIFNQKNNLSENKNIGLYKKTITFTSNNKIKDPIWGEKSKNSSQNKNKIEGIKNNLTNPEKTSDTNSSFYIKMKYYYDQYYNNFLLLLEKNKVKSPFLPKMDTKKYKYTLVLDLDETLVHYIEEENSAYVQVRPYADYFLKELSKHFEIVLFTAAEEDYTDIVLKELNKNNYISYILCRKYTELNNGSYIKDLSKLGRDLSKVVIVDNNKDNFSLQPENGLFISSYFGEQNDDELYILCGDLMKIIEKQPDDIRPIIKEIDTAMQNRYAENMYVLQ